MENRPVYALNLFNIKDKAEYLEYSRRSAQEVKDHGGKVIALGKFRETLKGDIQQREVLIVVEWTSIDAFRAYINDPALTELHTHREKGGGDYIWQLFDKLDDLRVFFK